MAGSIFGNMFRVSTWGESHGMAVGAVVDGVPAGLALCEEDIQVYLNRRRPGQGGLSTARQEADQVQILSGVFEGKTTGTPISLVVWNKDQRSKDYSNIKDCYRPGHADFGFDQKYGFRDYRGGGRSSGRETIGRVAAGASAARLLSEMGIQLSTRVTEMGGIALPEGTDPFSVTAGQLSADPADSVGGIVECRATGVPAGIGEPVFDKLDARLAAAMLSIGAVKGVEFGEGFHAARLKGSENNDAFVPGAEEEPAKVIDGDGPVEAKRIGKKTNHAGGILGGMSDGSEIVLRVAFKPTPSISLPQETVNRDGEPITLTISGRHDMSVVPRAAVVVECMTALVLADLMAENMSARLDAWKKIYG
ncbi:MAG: chorismate synthase [Verrucomicrobia bacterium]|nr:chorismate synthase [Verrucomicrobiota bacterium]